MPDEIESITFPCPSDLKKAAEIEAANRMTSLSSLCRLSLSIFLRPNIQEGILQDGKKSSKKSK